MNVLLEPLVVSLYPRWSDAGVIVHKLMQASADGYAIALADSEQKAMDFRRNWPEESRQPLLMLVCRPQETISLAVDALVTIGGRQPGRPLAVLLADGPGVCGFSEHKRRDWNQAFAKAVADAIVDIQVFEYTPNWAQSPPRIR